MKHCIDQNTDEMFYQLPAKIRRHYETSIDGTDEKAKIQTISIGFKRVTIRTIDRRDVWCFV